jgi:hypothetical protein
VTPPASRLGDTVWHPDVWFRIALNAERLRFVADSGLADLVAMP